MEHRTSTAPAILCAARIVPRPRYVNEFAGRFNDRPLDTLDQMAAMVRGADRKRLRYVDLIAHRGGGRAWAE